MKKRNSLLYYVLVFSLAQIAWFFLLGLWIYWYVSNYILINQVGQVIAPLPLTEGANIFALVSGLVLLVFISIGMSLIFIYLTRQMNITRLYDNFIANITHELKSPLSSIQLYLETLNSRTVSDEKKKEFYTLMLRDVNRLYRLITSILEISGLEQKRIAYNFEIHEADSLMQKLVEEARLQFKLSSDQVEFFANTDCRIVADRNALAIVVNNLFDNSVKYSVQKVQISVTVNQNGKYYIAEVRDSGIGISITDQQKIFNKFQRIYNRNSPNVKGTGLGLYWVREIVRLHGGKVAVHSDGLNKGTTFKIELPIYETSQKRYINRLLKLTERSKKSMEVQDEPESV